MAEGAAIWALGGWFSYIDDISVFAVAIFFDIVIS